MKVKISPSRFGERINEFSGKSIEIRTKRTSTSKISDLLFDYRDMVLKLVKDVTEFVNSFEESENQSVLSTKLIKALNEEIRCFSSSESSVMQELITVINITEGKQNNTNSKKTAKHKRWDWNRQDRSKSIDKRQSVSMSKDNNTRNAFDSNTDMNITLSRLHTLNLPEKLDIHQILDLEEVEGNSEADLSEFLNNLEERERRQKTNSKPKKNNFVTQNSKDKEPCLDKTKNSLISKTNRSRSVYGERSFKEQNEDLLSLKSDLTRTKKEVYVLEKEVELLKKEKYQTDKRLEQSNKTFENIIQEERTRNSNIIRNLQNDIDKREKELINLSQSFVDPEKHEKKKKSIRVLKQGYDNLIKEKKTMQTKIETLLDENESLKNQIDAIKESIDQFENNFKELENINQKLTEKMLITVQRENNLSQKVSRLSTKLKAYEKFFKDR